jgi:hypothetical protein
VSFPSQNSSTYQVGVHTKRGHLIGERYGNLALIVNKPKPFGQAYVEQGEDSTHHLTFLNDLGTQSKFIPRGPIPRLVGRQDGDVLPQDYYSQTGGGASPLTTQASITTGTGGNVNLTGFSSGGPYFNQPPPFQGPEGGPPNNPNPVVPQTQKRPSRRPSILNTPPPSPPRSQSRNRPNNAIPMETDQRVIHPEDAIVPPTRRPSLHQNFFDQPSSHHQNLNPTPFQPFAPPPPPPPPTTISPTHTYLPPGSFQVPEIGVENQTLNVAEQRSYNETVSAAPPSVPLLLREEERISRVIPRVSAEDLQEKLTQLKNHAKEEEEEEEEEEQRGRSRSPKGKGKELRSRSPIRPTSNVLEELRQKRESGFSLKHVETNKDRPKKSKTDLEDTLKRGLIAYRKSNSYSDDEEMDNLNSSEVKDEEWEEQSKDLVLWKEVTSANRMSIDLDKPHSSKISAIGHAIMEVQDIVNNQTQTNLVPSLMDIDEHVFDPIPETEDFDVDMSDVSVEEGNRPTETEAHPENEKDLPFSPPDSPRASTDKFRSTRHQRIRNRLNRDLNEDEEYKKFKEIQMNVFVKRLFHQPKYEAGEDSEAIIQYLENDFDILKLMRKAQQNFWSQRQISGHIHGIGDIIHIGEDVSLDTDEYYNILRENESFFGGEMMMVRNTFGKLSNEEYENNLTLWNKLIQFKNLSIYNLYQIFSKKWDFVEPSLLGLYYAASLRVDEKIDYYFAHLSFRGRSFPLPDPKEALTVGEQRIRRNQESQRVKKMIFTDISRYNQNFWMNVLNQLYRNTVDSRWNRTLAEGILFKEGKRTFYEAHPGLMANQVPVQPVGNDQNQPGLGHVEPMQLEYPQNQNQNPENQPLRLEYPINENVDHRMRHEIFNQITGTLNLNLRLPLTIPMERAYPRNHNDNQQMGQVPLQIEAPPNTNNPPPQRRKRNNSPPQRRKRKSPRLMEQKKNADRSNISPYNRKKPGFQRPAKLKAVQKLKKQK